MIFTHNNREIEMTFTGWIDDIQCDYAVYTDNGEQVSDDTVDELIESNASDIELNVMERAMASAEAYAEGDR